MQIKRTTQLRLWLRSRLSSAREQKFWIAVFAFLGLFALAVLVLIPKQDSQFTIDARTETTSLTASEKQPAWPTGNDGLDIEPLPIGCTPERFQPAPGSRIAVVSNAKGKSSITVSGGTGAAGVFRCKEGADLPASTDVTVLLPKASQTGQRSILRIAGQITVGEDIDVETISPTLLKTGTVSVETASFPSSANKLSTKHDLELGDRVQFLKEVPQEGTPSQQAEATGLIAFDGEEGVRVIASARAKMVSVVRVGRPESEAVAIAPTLLSRMQANFAYALLLPVGWLLVHLVRNLVDLSRTSSPEERREVQRTSRLRRLLGRRSSAIAAFLLAGTFDPSAKAAEPALLQVPGKEGQALVFEAAGACRALTAYHVVRDVDEAKLRLRDGTVLTATVASNAGDVALLSVEVTNGFKCPPKPELGLASSVFNQNSFQVQRVSSAGLERIPVTISAENEQAATFTPLAARDMARLEKGISGSPVMADGRAVALVTDVRPMTSEVITVRLDAIVKLFNVLGQSATGNRQVDTAVPRALTASSQPPAPSSQRVNVANLKSFFDGMNIELPKRPHFQAISYLSGTISRANGNLQLSRFDFEIDPNYMENQPSISASKDGDLFDFCANVQQFVTNKVSGPQCVFGFTYRANAGKYTTGSNEISLKFDDICSSDDVSKGKCLIWIYLATKTSKFGYGGHINLYDVIISGSAYRK